MFDILLIEDNPDDAEMIKRSLKAGGYGRVMWIQDGAQAVDFIYGKGEYEGRNVKECPRVIFLDIKLPKLNGLQILQHLKTNKETDHIPVVMFTSSQEEQDISESYNLGVNSYIVKPMKFDEFRASVIEAGTYWLSKNICPIYG